MKPLKPKHVYLISGWTNHDHDARRIASCYGFSKNKFEGPTQKLRSPCRLIAAEQELTRSSAHFSHIVLHYLGLIPLTKENEKIILRNWAHEEYNQYKLDNIRVIPGRFDGINLKIKEIKPSWWGIALDKIIIPAESGGYDGFLEMSRFPLAGAPRHCRLLSREKALDELVRRGYEPFVPFFRKAVEKYEGVRI